MKPVRFKNRMTGELVICDNLREHRQIIDGVEFLLVKREHNSRPFLMRKDALQKAETQNYVR